MKTDVILVLERLMEFCNDRWVEADKTAPSAFPNADVLTGRKMAFNDVLQYARRQVIELGYERTEPS